MKILNAPLPTSKSSVLDDEFPERLQIVKTMARLGMKLFPCAARGKVPLIKCWPTDASDKVTDIRRWAARFPGCNWASPTGRDASIFIIDVDGEDGAKSLAELEQNNGHLPKTLTTLTGREGGGKHLWFAISEGIEIRNSVGTLGRGLDVRGNGGYIIVPPSTHPEGTQYCWSRPLYPIAIPPQWLTSLLLAEGGAPKPPISVERFKILFHGERNDGLFRAGSGMRRKGASREEIAINLLAYNERRCKPPLDENEVLTIAASAAKYDVGGPDPLDEAWNLTQGQFYQTRYDQLIAICAQLQRARPDLTIVLPLRRIADLMAVHWTYISKLRAKAVKKGLLVPEGKYVPHLRAQQYRFRLTGIQLNADSNDETV